MEIELASLNFQEANIVEVEEIYESLAGLLGSINTPKAEIAELKLMMEKAYTYLEDAVKPIKSYGRMIFEDTPREDMYKSKSLAEYGSISPKSDPETYESASI